MSLDKLYQSALDPLTSIGKELESYATNIRQMILNRRGKLQLQGADGQIEINFGGRVIPVRRKLLLLPAVRDTMLAQVLLHYENAIPVDDKDRRFLDIDPLYAEWLVGEMVIMHRDQQHHHEIALREDHHKKDASFRTYHGLLFDKTTLKIELPDEQQQQEEEEDAHMAGQGQAEGEGEEQHRTLDNKMRSLQTAITEMEATKDELERFYRVMDPFMQLVKPEGGTPVMSATVLGTTVSTTEATLLLLGQDNALAKCFTKGSEGGDNAAVGNETSSSNFMKVVDFARRQRISPRGSVVSIPHAYDQEQLMKDFRSFGLPDMDMYMSLLTLEEMNKVLGMIGKPVRRRELVFKSAAYGFTYTKLPDKVGDKEGLLFVLRHKKYIFGVHMDGKLALPPGPRSTNYFDCPIFFFSVSGCFDEPKKITIAENLQQVEVAGRAGWIENDEHEHTGKLAFGNGRLWLGYRFPAADAHAVPDLSQCHHWIDKTEIPAGYKGNDDQDGSGLPAGDDSVVLDALEVWQVRCGE